MRSILFQHQQLLAILGQAFFPLEMLLLDCIIHQTYWGVVGQVMQISWLIRYNPLTVQQSVDIRYVSSESYSF